MITLCGCAAPPGGTVSVTAVGVMIVPAARPSPPPVNAEVFAGSTASRYQSTPPAAAHVLASASV